jgi:hypothetical protein
MIKRIKPILFVAVCVALLCVASLPSLKADEWDKKTILTFSQPVEVPGQVLPAGQYVFKLLDSQADRHIVQIFNADETKLYGTFLTIPDYRLEPTDQTVITFAETAAGAPRAIQAWFYPGDNYGEDFVYPKTQAAALAKANKKPVLSMSSDMTAHLTKPAKTAQEPHVVALKKAPVKAITPQQTEIDIAEVVSKRTN